MRRFSCPRCDQLVFFENSACLACGLKLGFDPGLSEIVGAEGSELTRCTNAGLAACNWLTDTPGLCRSCLLTRTRPSDGDQTGLEEFAAAEGSKRRLLFELGEHGLPVTGLAFELLSSEKTRVSTGHADGLITLDLAEADPKHRVTMREQLGEPYRTVLGHFRHEVGHFYWPQLVETGGRLDAFRELFGDERADYSEALARHYESGPTEDWRNRHVSAYATMHPWEDWAETFAHVLHISDAMQTAEAFGLRVPADSPLPAVTFRELLADWLPLSYALNQMSRSLGRDDLYPFILAPATVEKLVFVDEAIRGGAVQG